MDITVLPNVYLLNNAHCSSLKQDNAPPTLTMLMELFHSCVSAFCEEASAFYEENKITLKGLGAVFLGVLMAGGGITLMCFGIINDETIELTALGIGTLLAGGYMIYKGVDIDLLHA